MNRDSKGQSGVRKRILFAAYILACVIGSIVILRLLFPERWEVLFHSLKVSSPDNTEIDVGDPLSAKKVHKSLVNSRWPVEAFTYDEAIGFVMTPGFCSRMLHGRFSTCSHQLGYRVPTFESQFSFDKGGILSVGCSCTYGDTVEAEDTFTYHAGGLLGLPSYNYGVCGYSYVSSLLRLVDLADSGVLDKLAPSILILGAGHWLEERSLSPYYPTSTLRFGYSFLDKLDGSLFIRQPNDTYSLKHLFEFRKKYFPFGVREAEFTPERKRLIAEIMPRVTANVRDMKNRPMSQVTSQELYGFIISRMRQIALSYRMQFVILWLPSRRSSVLSPSLTHVIDSYDDIVFVDGRKALKNIAPDQLFFRPDGHPTVAGHREIARLIVATLKAESPKNESVP